MWQYTSLTYSFCSLELVHCYISVLTVASWPVYRFLRKQVMWFRISSHSEFSIVCCDHTVKSFGVVNETEEGVLGVVCFFVLTLLFLWSSRCWQFDPLYFLNLAWTPGIYWFLHCWSLDWRILSINLPVCEMSVLLW